MFSSVSAPFCWPTMTTRRPSRRARPVDDRPRRRRTAGRRAARRTRRSWPRRTPGFAADAGCAPAGPGPRPRRAGPCVVRGSGAPSAPPRSPSSAPSSPTRSASELRNEQRPEARQVDLRPAAAATRRADRTGSSRSRRASSSRSSGRATTRSMKPWANRNSERWKPAGSSWAIVPAETRDPAKPMSALGSAMLTSPTRGERGEDAAGGRIATGRSGTGCRRRAGARPPRASWPAASGRRCLPASGRRPRR